MGRFKAMPSAAPTTLAGQTAPLSRIGHARPALERDRKLTRRTLPDQGRYERLRQVGIHAPAGPMRAQAIDQAALVWAHTDQKHSSEHSDLKNCRILARYLYHEAILHGIVDYERALTHERVVRYLEHELTTSMRSRKTHRHILFRAGHVVYPQQFPGGYGSSAIRPPATPAATTAEVNQLYAQAGNLSKALRQRYLLVLDLITGAGLHAQEIRTLCGTDVEVVHLDGGYEIPVITVRSRGVIDRQVPVVCPIRGQRILDRAAEAGQAALMPLTRDGVVSRNAVNRLSEDVRRQGLRGFNAVALRNWWICDLAIRPGISAATLQHLAGIGDLRILADLKKNLPAPDAATLAQTLIDSTPLEAVA